VIIAVYGAVVIIMMYSPQLLSHVTVEYYILFNNFEHY